MESHGSFCVRVRYAFRSYIVVCVCVCACADHLSIKPALKKDTSGGKKRRSITQPIENDDTDLRKIAYINSSDGASTY